MNQQTFFQLVSILLALRYTPATSYTSFNIAAIAYAAATRDAGLLPFLLTNTAALSSTFYLTCTLVDRTTIPRIRERLAMSPAAFYLGDLCVHTIPTLLMCVAVMRYRSERTPPQPFVCLYTLTLNLLWGAIHGYNLDHIYAPLSIRAWAASWGICIASHLLVGYVLAV